MAKKIDSATAVNAVGSAVLDTAAPSTSSASEQELAVIESDGEEASEEIEEVDDSEFNEESSSATKPMSKVEQLLQEMKARNQQRDRKSLIAAFLKKPNVHLVKGLRIVNVIAIAKDSNKQPIPYNEQLVRFTLDKEIVGNVARRDEDGNVVKDENYNTIYDLALTNSFLLHAFAVHSCMLRCSNVMSNMTANEFRMNTECITTYFVSGSIDIAIVELNKGDEYKSPFAGDNATPYVAERDMVIIEPLCIAMSKNGENIRNQQMLMRIPLVSNDANSAALSINAADSVDSSADMPF